MAFRANQPVKAVFAVYKDAMEAQALALMGRKMRAAQTLYGDEVGGAIVPVEEGNFERRMAAWLIVRYVLQVEEITCEVIRLTEMGNQYGNKACRKRG